MDEYSGPERRRNGGLGRREDDLTRVCVYHEICCRTIQEIKGEVSEMRKDFMSEIDKTKNEFRSEGRSHVTYKVLSILMVILLGVISYWAIEHKDLTAEQRSLAHEQKETKILTAVLQENQRKLLQYFKIRPVDVKEVAEEYDKP